LHDQDAQELQGNMMIGKAREDLQVDRFRFRSASRLVMSLRGHQHLTNFGRRHPSNPLSLDMAK
jgi:hypothetical protein